MILKRCEFCHKYIFKWGYQDHVSQHLQLREDGQQTGYSSLPEAERQGVEKAYLEAPKWYEHEKCGRVTGMPEHIIKTYLTDPWYYSDETFCHGCQTHVAESECYWTETGQNLAEYKNELKQSAEFRKRGT